MLGWIWLYQAYLSLERSKSPDDSYGAYGVPNPGSNASPSCDPGEHFVNRLHSFRCLNIITLFHAHHYWWNLILKKCPSCSGLCFHISLKIIWSQKLKDVTNPYNQVAKVGFHSAQANQLVPPHFLLDWVAKLGRSRFLVRCGRLSALPYYFVNYF